MNHTTPNQKILEKTGSFHDYLAQQLQDPDHAAVYLQVALDEYQQDGNTEAFMLALRSVAQANGGIGILAKKADLSRQNLYHTLSSKGNPSLKKLGSILTGLGFHLSISPISLSQQA
jgi:probable addiction module antidote protein